MPEIATHDIDDRRAQRAALRRLRRAVSTSERQRAARAIGRYLAATHWLRPGTRVGIYAALAEEIDTRLLIALARSRGCELLLPRITAMRSRRMTFTPIGPRHRLNALGIPEPASTHRVAAQWLHVILIPLVGFDAQGNRLGMGAGFYDRALAFRRYRRTWRGPRLVGLAYAIQKLPHIAVQPHDIPLDAVLTEHGMHTFRGHR